MRTYRLYRQFFFMIFLLLGLMTIFGIFLVLPELLRSKELFEKGFLFVWLGVLGWVWYAYLRIPYKITILDDDFIKFQSVLRKTLVPIQDIKSIKSPYPGFIDVKHLRGKIHMILWMDGFCDFVSTLKSVNPSIELKGC